MRKKYYNKWARKSFFSEMILQHGDRCMICGEHVRHLVIDHDHETGIMRGVLCIAHNSGLGNFQDDPKLLRKAANYLEKEVIIDENNEPPLGGRKEKYHIMPEILHALLDNPTYLSDAARARELTRLYIISYAAAQSRVQRERKHRSLMH